MAVNAGKQKPRRGNSLRLLRPDDPVNVPEMSLIPVRKQDLCECLKSFAEVQIQEAES